MKNNKKLLSKFLTVILSTMMIFSSVLVVNTNVVFALEGEETTEEVAPEKEEEKVDEKNIDKTSDETQLRESEEPVLEESQKSDDSEYINENESNELNKEQKQDLPTENSQIQDNSINETKPKTVLKTLNPNKVSKVNLLFYGGILHISKLDTSIPKGTIYPEPQPDTNIIGDILQLLFGSLFRHYKFEGWYYRVKTGLLSYKEYKYDFNNPINQSYTFYGKWIYQSKISGSEGGEEEIPFNENEYDFKVKGENGSIINNGYSYYKLADEGLYPVFDSVYDDDGNVVSEAQKFNGNGFDLAIRDAQEETEIELIHDITIEKPLEIWANINFNLNGHTITLDSESTDYSRELHILDEEAGSNKTYVDTIPAVMIVSNAKTKIYDGTIVNHAHNGIGIVSYAFNSYYNTTLSNLTIDVVDSSVEETKKNDAVIAGYQVKMSNTVSELYNGFVNIFSGHYDGYLYNYQGGYIKLSEGETVKEKANNDEYVDVFVKNEFENNPTKYSNDVNNRVEIKDGYDVWETSTQYRYFIDKIAEVSIDGVKYPSLGSAIASIQVGQSKTIKLLKNITFDSNVELGNSNDNRTYTIDTNGYTIKGGIVKIPSGQVSISGNGYFDCTLEVYGNAILNIANGHFGEIDKTSTTASIIITGGSFVSDVSSYVANGYVCTYNDLPSHPYCVSDESLKNQVSAFNDGVEINLDSYPLFTQTLNAINTGLITVDEIRLNRDIQVHDVLIFKKPVNVNLNNHILYSDVNIPDALAGNKIVSIYNNIPNCTLSIQNGTIINNSSVNTGTIYGIYNAAGNVTLEDVDLDMQTKKYTNMYAIYNNSASADFILLGSTVKAENVKSKASIIYNKGTLIFNKSIKDSTRKSTLTVTGSGSCPELTGIDNRGNLSISDNSRINISSGSSQYATIKAISSSGNIDIEGFAEVYGNSTKGTCYAIYQEVVNDDETKTINLTNGASLYSTKSDSSEGVIAYGIYTEYLDNENDEGITNINLSEALIQVAAPTDFNDVAYGIVSNGGFINMDTNASNNTGIYVMGGNGTIGISCGYKGLDKSINNTLAKLDLDVISSGVDSYCVVSTTASINTYIVSGYYHSDVVDSDNHLLTGQVRARGGFFSKDVTENLSNNYKCMYLDGTNHDNVLNGITYDYEVTRSNCSANVVVYNEGNLTVNAEIIFDEVMKKDDYAAKHYGVKFDIEGRSKPVIRSIYLCDPTNYKSTEKFVFTFDFPVKNMMNNIAVSIVKLDDLGNVIHTYHICDTYSVKQYYYNMLVPKNEHSEAMKELAKATLNLGAFAQIYFDYKVDQLIRDELNEKGLLDNSNYLKNFNESDIKDSFSTSGIDKYLEDRNAALVLGGSTDLRYTFMLRNDDSIDNYEFKCNGIDISAIEYHYLDASSALSGKESGYYNINVNYKGSTETIPVYYDGKTAGCSFDIISGRSISDYSFTCEGKTITPSIGRYYVDITNINPNKYGELYELEVVEKGTESPYVIAYSPLEYIYEAYKIAGQTDIDLANLMNALYHYYLVAKSFYGIGD